MENFNLRIEYETLRKNYTDDGLRNIDIPQKVFNVFGLKGCTMTAFMNENLNLLI